MPYACKYAYLGRNAHGKEFILCEKCPPPDTENAKEVVHAMCPYQKPCKTKAKCGLLDGWKTCIRLQESKATAEPETVKTAEKAKTKRKKAE